MPTSKTYDTTPAEDFEPSLLHFKGLITDVRDEIRHNETTNKDSTVIIFDCAEVEVIEAKAPFTMPVYQVEIRWLPFPGTQSSAFQISAEKAGYKGDLNGLIGKRIEWHYTSAMLNLPKRVTNEDGTTSRGEGYENRMGKCWQVVAIEGVENTSNKLGEAILNMADGKTATEFKSAFLSDMSLQGLSSYDEVATQVMQNTHLDLLVSVGQLTVDSDGKYHKTNG